MSSEAPKPCKVTLIESGIVTPELRYTPVLVRASSDLTFLLTSLLKHSPQCSLIEVGATFGPLKIILICLVRKDISGRWPEQSEWGLGKDDLTGEETEAHRMETI